MPRITDSSQPKSIELPNLKRPAPTSDRPSPSQSPSQLSQTQQQAQEAAENLKVALVGNHQQRLVGLSTALDKAEERREEVLDRLSDRPVSL